MKTVTAVSAALIALGCYTPGATANTASTNSSPATDSTIAAESATITIAPMAATLASQGTVEFDIRSSHVSTEPNWPAAHYTLGALPDGVTAHLAEFGDNRGDRHMKLTLSHTGQTTVDVAQIDVSVHIEGATDTKTITLTLPQSVGDPTLVRTFTANVDKRLTDNTKIISRINSTFPQARRVRIAINLDHSCAQKVGLAVVTPDGRHNVLKNAQQTTLCRTWRGERSATFSMRSESQGVWALHATGAGDPVAQLKSWTVTFNPKG